MTALTIDRPAAAAAVQTRTSDVTVLDAAPEAHWLGVELMEVLLTGEQSHGAYDVIRATVAPGGGPPPHRHTREDELFYVVDGTFSFLHNDETFTAGAGTTVFLPRGGIHCFKNVGDDAGTLIIIATPSAFADFVVEAGLPCVDRNAVPEMITAAAMQKIADGCAAYEMELLPTHKPTREIAPPRTAKDLWVLGLHVRTLLGADDTQRKFAVAEIGLHPGDFVPPHLHELEDEIFYVLSGQVEFDLPHGTVTAAAGTFVHVPKGTFHSFRNASDDAAKLFDLHTPGGFEKFFEEVGTPWPDLNVVPATANADLERFVRICHKHGMRMLDQA